MPAAPHTVLLVEDNPGDADLIAELIGDGTGPPIRLVHATRLREVPSFLATEHADVVILDLSLPDAEGMDTVRAMLEIAPDCPIVVLTSHGDDETALAAVHAGAQDYLVKGEDDGRVIRRALRYAMERQALERDRADLLRRAEEARALAETERASAVRARQAAEQMERRSSFLAAAGSELLVPLDPHATLTALARVVVPALARRAATFLVHADGELELVCRVGSATDVDPDPLSAAEVRGRLDAGRDGAAPRSAASRPAASHDEPLILALDARGSAIGVLVVADPPDDVCDVENLRLLRELCDRAALGVDNGQSYEAARRAVSARDQVLGVVSHDLRNPISAVIMCAESLTAAPAPSPAEVVRIGTLVRESAQWMQRIIRDLLDVSAIEAGRLAVAAQPIDCDAVLERLRALHAPIAAERGIRVECPDLDGGVLPRVMADADRLVQGIGNLVANAIRFSPRDAEVRIVVAVADGEAAFRVSDEGPGIAAADQQRVFDRFWQAREGRLGGAGLGLAIARGIAEAHGGRLTVESRPGEGSTFSFFVPLAPGEGLDEGAADMVGGRAG